MTILADLEQLPPDEQVAAIERDLAGLGLLTGPEERGAPAMTLAGALSPWRSYRLQPAPGLDEVPERTVERIRVRFDPWIGRCEIVITAYDGPQVAVIHPPEPLPLSAAALEGFSRGCRVRRQAPPLVSHAAEKAFRHPGITPPLSVQRACAAISERMDQFSAGFDREPRYHNRHHTIDTLMAVASLVRTALRLGQIDERDATNCIVAMNGHDLLHDGTINRPGHHLETLAATAVCTIMRDTHCTEDDIAVVRELILATDPKQQSVLRTQKLERQQTRLETMCLIAGDADLFASLLPGIGEQLSVDLAEEWRAANISFPAMPDTAKGRRNFLSFVTAMSDAGEALGLPDILKDQLARLPA